MSKQSEYLNLSGGDTCQKTESRKCGQCSLPLVGFTRRLIYCLALVASQLHGQTFLTNGLVAYYPLDGNANDASGNGFNGVPYNVTPTTNRFGQASSAMSFNSNGGSYIDCGSPSLLQFTGDFTVTAWVNPSGGTLDPRVVSYGADPGYELLTDLPTSNFSFGMNLGNTKFGEQPIFPTDKWHFVACLLAGSNAFIFVDGAFVVTNQVSTPPIFSSDLNIGRKSGPLYDSYGGAMGEVRFYNRALSASELNLLFMPPPNIFTQPQSILVNAHCTASFSVAASGGLPLSYQWALNGSNISGATSNTLAISNVTQCDLGTYAVVVTNAHGVVTSSNAVLSMYPFLATPFGGLDTYWGYTNTLSVGAWGTGPLDYQWFDDGNAIDGATNQTLTLTGVQFTNAGLYSVVVTSPLGSVTNTPEQVVVNPAGVSFGGLYPSVLIQGVVGYNYIIQSTANLSDTNSWATVTNLTLTQPIQLWIDSNTDASLPANPNRFYKVLPGQP